MLEELTVAIRCWGTLQWLYCAGEDYGGYALLGVFQKFTHPTIPLQVYGGYVVLGRPTVAILSRSLKQHVGL